jgi:hypothetical protein
MPQTEWQWRANGSQLSVAPRMATKQQKAGCVWCKAETKPTTSAQMKLSMTYDKTSPPCIGFWYGRTVQSDLHNKGRALDWHQCHHIKWTVQGMLSFGVQKKSAWTASQKQNIPWSMKQDMLRNPVTLHAHRIRTMFRENYTVHQGFVHVTEQGSE